MNASSSARAESAITSSESLTLTGVEFFGCAPRSAAADSRPSKSASVVGRRRDNATANAAATVLTVHVADPTGYGRVIRDKDDRVARIVEHADANANGDQHVYDHAHQHTRAYKHAQEYARADEHAHQYARAYEHAHQYARGDEHAHQYARGYEHAHQYARADEHAHQHARPDEHAHQHPRADEHAHQHAHGNSDSDEHRGVYRHAHRYPDSDPNADRHDRAHEHGDRHADAYQHTDTDADGRAVRYARGDGDADVRDPASRCRWRRVGVDPGSDEGGAVLRATEPAGAGGVRSGRRRADQHPGPDPDGQGVRPARDELSVAGHRAY